MKKQINFFKKGIKHLKWKIQNMSVIIFFNYVKKYYSEQIINYTFEVQFFYKLMCFMNMLIYVMERTYIVHN